MKRCVICGEIVDDDVAVCPVCKQSKFEPIEEASKAEADACLATVHGVGDGNVGNKEINDGLRANYTAECAEVGMYLAMARAADREGYPEIAEAFQRYAMDEAGHAAKFAELLGECVTSSTKKNLELRVGAEAGACDGKFQLAKLAKELGLDAVHDLVHDIAKDEARHCAGFKGLLKRYFNE
ncbi:MAG: NADH peroxidase [Clostridia bacterium]|nr:NADH peroxidase [Clostridia bacterium]